MTEQPPMFPGDFETGERPGDEASPASAGPVPPNDSGGPETPSGRGSSDVGSGPPEVVVDTNETHSVTVQAWDVGDAEVDLLRARFKLAKEISRTEFVPASMRGKPEAILACFMAGRELRLGPMASLKHVHIIDGRPYLSAEMQLALVRREGHTVEGSANPSEAHVLGTRKDTGESMEVTWTLETAMQAGLVDKIVDGKPIARSSGGKRMPWEQYPQSMLWARAVTQLTTQLFSDVFIGVEQDANSGAYG